MPYLFPAIITRDLEFSYRVGRPALSGVSLSIEPGTIHAILGASGTGKSTLRKLLMGQESPSGGTIHVQGKICQRGDLRDPSALGIRSVFSPRVFTGKQTVGDAIGLEEVPTRFGLVLHKERDKRIAGILSKVGLGDLDPNVRFCSLSAGTQKLIEIASICSKSTTLLVLDDPTASLTTAEANVLYENLSSLRSGGIAILYLTSRPEEALDVADVVSVMRDGRLVSTHDPDEIFVAGLEGEMVGREVPPFAHTRQVGCGPEVALRIEGLSVEHCVNGVSLKAKRGEVIGLLGLEGGGQSEVVQAAAGVLPKDSGEIFLQASSVASKVISREHAVAAGIGFVPNPSECSGSAGSDATASPGRLLRNLNDQNPQKKAIGASLQYKCSVLFFDQPTKGLNLACRLEVWQSIASLSDQGITIVVSSTDPRELMQVSDRIAVIANGHVARWFERREFSQERLEKLLRTGK